MTSREPASLSRRTVLRGVSKVGFRPLSCFFFFYLGWTNAGSQVNRGTALGAVAHKSVGPSEMTLLGVTQLAPGILK